MIQLINGHLVVYYPGSQCWVVDGVRWCYSVFELAGVVGLSYAALCEVLYI